MQTVFVAEGGTKIEIPNPDDFRTKAGDYAPSLTSVFYNPNMEFCRDISVSVVQVASKIFKNIWACDPLAGVGVRGIRYAKEVKGVRRSVVNDISNEAFELINRNVKLNELESLVEARSADANIVLHENQGRFNFVDIDPFGSPARFVSAACSALSRKGVLALTATDTAPLAGTYPKTCLRRYGAMPLKVEYRHEVGARILAGFVQRIGTMHEISLTPILTHATLHYFRIYLLANRGAQRADQALEKIGFISHCKACLRRNLTYGIAASLPKTCECGSKLTHAGPMWLGSLIDKQFTLSFIEDLSMRNFRLKHEELSLLSRCAEEAEGPPTFYDLNELAASAGTRPPKITELIAKIRSEGYFASRTHFSDTGIRTDAATDGIKKMVSGL